MSVTRKVPAVLSIAGSDSGGGAGIQADLKAFARCGVHGMTAITAITAQNTVGVAAVHPIPAVKIGMLGTEETIEAVVAALELVGDAPVVLDPVMVSESGARLLDEGAEAALRERLLPLATVVTPNIPEANALARPDALGEGGSDAETLAQRVHALGPDVVVVTGGHRDDTTDVYFDGSGVVAIPGRRFPDGAAHGSGCTHSSALAASLALGLSPLEAARRAKEVAAEAVRDGLRGLGAGAGPVDVFGLQRG